MNGIKLNDFRLLVNDFVASLHFWHEIVGLPIIFQDEHNIYAELEAGNVRLELLRADYFAASMGKTQAASTEAGPRGVVVFKADNADEAYADLVKRGASPLAPPQNHPAGFARTALLAAPDGYVLEVFSSLRSFPHKA